jgi:predicted tellurium resistance membrane protein TerC
VSIPIIVAGSQIVLKLMDRFPIIITLGAMLLGWIAGQMIYTDPGLKGMLPASKTWEYAAAIAGALLVFAIAKLAQRGKEPAEA